MCYTLWEGFLIHLSEQLCDKGISSPSHRCPRSWWQPGSSVHEISQARILEWVAISFSRGSSWPRDRTCIPCIVRQILYHWATRKANPREEDIKNSGCRPKLNLIKYIKKFKIWKKVKGIRYIKVLLKWMITYSNISWKFSLGEKSMVKW